MSLTRRQFLLGTAAVIAGGVVIGRSAQQSFSYWLNEGFGWKHVYGVTDSGVANHFIPTTQVSDLAFWDTALTDEQMAQLASGAPPLSVEPKHILRYMPMVQV